MREKDQNLDTNKWTQMSRSVDLLRQHLTPEQQYLLGAVCTWAYLALLLDPQQLPEISQQMAQFINHIPIVSESYRISVVVASGITSATTVDGANRIATESLPSYKAYWREFVVSN